MLRLFSKIYFKISGWKIEETFKPRPDKFIMIIMPHTANFDFFLGVMARSIMRIPNAKFLGKSQLFRFPYGFIFRAFGGYPVDRSKGGNLVDSVVDIFNQHEKFVVALAPEGTRSKVDRLKTGFYHIARKADIPIVAVGFDFGTKVVSVREPFYPSNNFEDDMKELIGYYSTIKGKYPELGIDMSIYEKTISQNL